ncbi:hypothetical protein [[Clostridium] innocuum]|uniref:hypothetical protein n=1 Tax=Clostridium innocuum TaxID=1522 RepID=UPI001AF4539C|nr:hypothetical protein [[Clostridium] innocuum]MDU1018787.1 hypothetical protein [Bifidobacterium breve]QSI26884.1 hypothetical protein GKZ87_16020 [Erysipelotrichaceae bacterium 66202529]MCC2831850.1 hypothetical protein [[Clostridium] innocuum]MCR0248566.1 hypothetical protein [[Clostridium] innocuum]MCR0261077.1 hypothetical protein [[Clostridium] innocuum]
MEKDYDEQGLDQFTDLNLSDKNYEYLKECLDTYGIPEDKTLFDLYDMFDKKKRFFLKDRKVIDEFFNIKPPKKLDLMNNNTNSDDKQMLHIIDMLEMQDKVNEEIIYYLYDIYNTNEILKNENKAFKKTIEILLKGNNSLTVESMKELLNKAILPIKYFLTITVFFILAILCFILIFK